MGSRGHSSSRRALALIAPLLLTGCSLWVQPALQGHPCGGPNNDTCLAGYSCNAQGICVSASSGGGGCPTACPTGETCVRQVCVSQCLNQACPPGTGCVPGATGAQCVSVMTSGMLGSPCHSDAECMSAPDLFCLTPYGNTSSGVCTMVCDPSADPCTTAGETCTFFPSSGVMGINLCASPSLVPCKADADCAGSNLICEVMYAEQSPAVVVDGGTIPIVYAAAAACGAPLTGTGVVPAGAPCAFTDSELCRTGLCVIANGAGGDTDRYCSTPCSQASDCAAFTSGPEMGECLPVSIKEQSGTPVTRALLCVSGSSSIGTTCTDAALGCNADAPECVPSEANPSVSICAPYCVTGLAACTVDTTTLHCEESGMNAGICY